MKQVLAVVGPTGSGKTALAIAVAEHLDTEIVSADSMQFYRGMEIGTGAPSAEELARVTHHFVGHLDLSDEMSAGEFETAARAVVADLNARGKTAVVVGGSGLYVQALIDGLFEGPGKAPAIRERLQAEAEEQGAGALYARLEAVDPEYAERIEPGDLRRIVRALEVYEVSGRPISELFLEQQRRSKALDAVQVALDWPRDVLYERINARVDAMLEAGFVDEVARLLDEGHREHIEGLRPIGYREIAAHLRGDCTLDEAVESMKMFTRRYAKRQLTWFRGDSRIQWLKASETASFHLEQSVQLLLSESKVQA
ncbi:MAG: tRNA (adenosine(37)-N6)-dimethylallyltransferase MiaA [Candidatus Hydrogenedentes bacterium]|nr:tRNA (adenosine(37)-N6)-dimethylallyltransferase MiaA [Candidatus Hydrogenedentota bacterium]